MDHSEQSLDFSKALLYRANNAFIEDAAVEPHSRAEIFDNLKIRIGGPYVDSSYMHLFGLVYFIAPAVFLLAMRLAANSVPALVDLRSVRLGGYLAVYFIILFVLTVLSGQTGKNVMAAFYYSQHSEKAYKGMTEDGEIVNGTIVGIETQGDKTLITYTFKTPELAELKRTYQTSSTKYTSADVGQEVVVLYLDGDANALL